MSNINDIDLAPLGIWTPWAEILCYECHGPKFGERTLNEDKFKKRCLPEEIRDEYSITTCTRCNKTIQIRSSIAHENNLVKDLRKLNIDAEMAQTGGMCSAAYISTTNEVVFYSIIYDDYSDGMYCLIKITDDDKNYNYDSLVLLETKSLEKLKNYVLGLSDLSYITNK